MVSTRIMLSRTEFTLSHLKGCYPEGKSRDHASVSEETSHKWLSASLKKACFYKHVSSLIIRTAQHIDAELMQTFERFLQNLLVEFYLMKDFNFLTLKPKQRKILVLDLWCKT